MPGPVSGSAGFPAGKGIKVKYLVVFFLLLLAYTLIYTGISKISSGLTMAEGIVSAVGGAG